MMNMDDFVVDPREPVQGAANNEQLPVLFVFLLNHLAKAVMAQLALEGVKPISALSVGIFTVRIFASPEYLWRGKSLIDILIAKFRMSCPVLFGVRASDTTNGGRALLGWKKTPNGDWIALELHAQRMMGFAAGYAAICLRDFSKSATLSHPYAIAHYWKAIACLTATPADELTKTQCYVLKALIDHFEKKFVAFYGSAAIAALQVATITVPKRVATQNDATIALGALATKMHLDLGINLRRDAFRA
jgi:nucleoporin GLE1